MEIGLTDEVRKMCGLRPLPAPAEGIDSFFCWDMAREDLGSRKLLIMPNAATSACAVTRMAAADWKHIDEVARQLIARRASWPSCAWAARRTRATLLACDCHRLERPVRACGAGSTQSRQSCISRLVSRRHRCWKRDLYQLLIACFFGFLMSKGLSRNRSLFRRPLRAHRERVSPCCFHTWPRACRTASPCRNRRCS